MTITLTTDLIALRAAIDAGDDSALGPLADLLAEWGDPLAEGLRRLLAGGYRLPADGGLPYWARGDDHSDPWVVPLAAWVRLRGEWRTVRRGLDGAALRYPWKEYHFRHVAYLDLAAALAD
jgi:hypothetical protein